MKRAFPIAVLCGLLVGLGTYWLLLPDWFLAAGTAAVYAGAAYFYVAFDVSLLGSTVRFDDRTDRLGYAVGLFGTSVSPLAVAQRYGHSDASTLPIVISFVGVIAFLHLLSRAQQREYAR